MGKYNRQIKAAHDTGNQMARVEQTETIDDNLLPDAAEIEKLRAIDPDIMSWLKTRAEKEQEFRHSAFDKKIVLTDKNSKREHDTARIALLIYFVLVIICVVAAFVLLYQGKKLEGSIFGGAGVIIAFAVLVSSKSSSKQNQDD